MEAIVIIGIIFGSITAVILVPFSLRTQERIRVQETLRAAIENGQVMPTDALENAARNVNLRPPPSSSRDLRVGIIWLGIGLGLCAFGVALSFDYPDSTTPMIALGAFPIFIGLAFVALSFFNRPKS
ncbi:DUF6249 domain-containing protein [Phenylobacterium sp.]|uniref:DUF6249 domain-containing protein n=1 Tax=Phenylobacterium sp. TaxID=1871053 RepID=UPI002F422065